MKFVLLLLLLSEPYPLCFSAQSGVIPDPGGFHLVSVTGSSWTLYTCIQTCLHIEFSVE